MSNERYHRHSLIDWFDQDTVSGSHMAVVGVGAVGNEIVKSLVLLGRLYQQIKTGHYDEALEDESKKCELARLGLSTKAGYVYGLLGLSHKKNQTDDQAQAKKYWRQATMLIRPKNLVEKLPELAEMEQAYPSAGELPEASEVE